MTEQQPYQVLAVLPGFELRNYPAHLVAQVTVHSSIEEAGNTAFRYLFGYISGQNQSNHSHLSQEPGNDRLPVRIPMTAPVVLQPQIPDETYTVAFVLPETLSADAAPDPDDPAVAIVAVPESRGAAASFPGRWTSRNYLDHAAALGGGGGSCGFDSAGAAAFRPVRPALQAVVPSTQ